MKKIPIAYKYLDGRAVFLVPLVRDGILEGPRMPKSAQATCYYSKTRDDICAIVTTGNTTTYMRKRKYTQEIGIAVYDQDGIKHDELDRVLDANT